MPTILRPVDGGPAIDEVRALFVEYGESLNFDLCFQSFDRELRELPGVYSPPHGRLLLADVDGQPAGCAALKPLADGVCEMKRLCVRPRYRGLGIGMALAKRILADAKQAGYSRMRLDTISGLMDPAITLYRSLGFEEIPPYYSNPIPNAVYFELKL